MALFNELVEEGLLEPIVDAYPILVITYKQAEYDALRRGQKRSFDKVYKKELQEDAMDYGYYRITDLTLPEDDELVAEGLVDPLFIPGDAVRYIADLDDDTKSLLCAGVRIASNDKNIGYVPKIDNLLLSAVTNLEEAFTEFDKTGPALKRMEKLIADNERAVKLAEEEEANAKRKSADGKSTGTVDEGKDEQAAPQPDTEDKPVTPKKSDPPETNSQEGESTNDAVDVILPIDKPKMQQKLRDKIIHELPDHYLNADTDMLQFKSNKEIPELDQLADAAKQQIKQVIQDGNELLAANQLQNSKLIYQKVRPVLDASLEQIMRVTELNDTADNQFRSQLNSLSQERDSAFEQASKDVEAYQADAQKNYEIKRMQAGEDAKKAAMAKFDREHGTDVSEKTADFKRKLEKNIETHFFDEKHNVIKSLNDYRVEALDNVVDLALQYQDDKQGIDEISKDYELQANKIMKECQDNIQEIRRKFNGSSRSVLSKLAKARAKAQAKKMTGEGAVTQEEMYRAIQAVNKEVTESEKQAGSKHREVSEEHKDESDNKPNRRHSMTTSRAFTVAGALIVLCTAGGFFGGSMISKTNQKSTAVRADTSRLATNSSDSTSSQVINDASSTNSASSNNSRSSYLNSLKIGDSVTIRPNNKNITAKVTSLNSNSVTVETADGNQYSIRK